MPSNVYAISMPFDSAIGVMNLCVLSHAASRRGSKGRGGGSARGGGTDSDLLEPQLVGVVTPSGNVRYWFS